MTSPVRRLAALAAAGALLLVAGCSSQDEPAPEPTATETATSEVSTEAPTPEQTEADEAATEQKTADAGDEGDPHRESREHLASIEFAEGADPELCDDVFGMDDDSITSLFFATDGTVEHFDATVARLRELAAGAPSEVADHLVTTAEALERAAAAESQDQRDQAGADHEAAYMAVGEYCFGTED